MNDMQKNLEGSAIVLDKLHLIYFSPTGTTRRTAEQIAQGINAQSIEHHDLTLQASGINLAFTEGLAVIGVPVYAGRVPEICLQRMQHLSAVQIPAVVVVLYGNREFEDALLELADTVRAKGFVPVAGAAFIGEHSYSTRTQSIAAGRPDQDDLTQARQFGEAIAENLKAGHLTGPPDIPGSVPYRERPPLGGIAPSLIAEHCTLCGICVSVCPTQVISMADSITTDAAGCVMCCACVKNCPVQARILDHQMLNARREMLTVQYSQRKAPSIFQGAGGASHQPDLRQ